MILKDRWQPVLKTVVILDLLKEHLGSDYKTAKALGVPPNYLSNWRAKGYVMNDAHGLKAAEILDFPADAMLLSLAAERAMNTPNALEIQRLAEQHYPPDWGSEADHSDAPNDKHKKTA